jgi:hypothetical protein
MKLCRHLVSGTVGAGSINIKPLVALQTCWAVSTAVAALVQHRSRRLACSLQSQCA